MGLLKKLHCAFKVPRICKSLSGVRVYHSLGSGYFMTFKKWLKACLTLMQQPFASPPRMEVSKGPSEKLLTHKH